MTGLKLIFRNLIYYRRIHFWTVLGVMVSTAILAGALIIGDSIRYSLRQIVFDRLGKTEFALSSGDRFINTHVADKVAEKLKTPVAPLLLTRGMVVVDGGKQKVNNVQVVGFDRRFASLSNSGLFQSNIAADEAIINTHIARRLHIKEGDEFLLRVNNPDLIPKDMVWTSDLETSLAKRFIVKSLVSDKEFGGFNLKTDQIAPNTVFVSLDFLGREMGLEGKSNVMLVAEKPEDPLSLDVVSQAFRKSWSLSDAGFTLTQMPGRNQVELKSERIFIDHLVAQEAQNLYPNSHRILSYFVNEIRFKERTAPYSFVSASSDFDLSEDEILINEWLARDLNAKKDDPITLTYFLLGTSRNLIEASSEFRVKSVVPLRGVYADRSLMPDFPGIGDVENCRYWDPGIPIDLSKIRDKDGEYWEDYRGTPKVFLSLRAAQRMWQNRYGDLTAIRFPSEDREEIEEKLTTAVDPASLGFFFRNVRSEGLAASAQSIGFDQLFLGLSFFIITAALLLTGLLFVFTIEQRSEEIGVLLALGFPRKQVGRLFLIEGMILVICGSLWGSFCGIVYHQIILIALKSVWREIVGTSSLHIHVTFSTILLAVSIGIVINFLTILLVARNRLRQPVADLQKGITKLEVIYVKKPKLSLTVSGVCFTGVFILLVLSLTGAMRQMIMPFFTAGSLLLIGGIAFANYLLAGYLAKVKNTPLSIWNIGIRNAVRKRLRSLAVIGLLAMGVFIVFTVGANRQSAVQDAESRGSGTGGFAMVGESVIPILYDLNSGKGREFYSLQDVNADKIKFVSFRVKEGDDASCLNLNRVSTPQLIGVNPYELSKRRSFTFVKMTNEANPDDPWKSLEKDLSGDVIPGVADQTVITWGLGKAVGDTLEYLDENVRRFRIKLVGGLVNSIFQGNVIISAKAFIRKYPSISGSRLFLVDAPFSEIGNISKKVNWALQDYGIDLTKTSDRLAAFNQVENTYLSIFFILGTFGLFIGSIGIGIVIGRNVLERRGELALLQAVGFRKTAIHGLLIAEHSVLLISGVIIGMVSALLATIPALTASGANVPLVTMVFLLILVAASGGFWTYSATVLATKKNLLPSLRNE